MPDLFPPPGLLDSTRWRGLRIGLLGGSFNPAHEGHVHISRIALRALCLDCVWWLVSPQNPFKSARHMAPYTARLEQCRALTADSPWIVVSGLEQSLGTVRTRDTLSRMLPRFPGTSFVWVTGFDNALDFHRWHRWRDILNMVSTAHVARPPALQLVQNGPLRQLSGQAHIIAPKPGVWPLEPRTTFWLLDSRLNGLSSTQLRQNGSAKKLFAPLPAKE